MLKSPGQKKTLSPVVIGSCCTQQGETQSKSFTMAKSYPPVNIRFNLTTKIGSKMGGAFTYQPKWDPKPVLTNTAISTHGSQRRPRRHAQISQTRALPSSRDNLCNWSWRTLRKEFRTRFVLGIADKPRGKPHFLFRTQIRTRNSKLKGKEPHLHNLAANGGPTCPTATFVSVGHLDLRIETGRLAPDAQCKLSFELCTR